MSRINFPGLGFFTQTGSDSNMSLPGVGFLSYEIPTPAGGGIDYNVYSAEAQLARDWITSQQQTFAVNSGAFLDVVNQSSESDPNVRIGPARNIEGVYSLIAPPPTSPVALTINTPFPGTTIDSGYSGDIRGTVKSSEVGSGIQVGILGYVITDMQYLQWTVTCDSDYTFVSSANGQAGTWKFVVINQSSGGGDIGEFWDKEINNKSRYDSMYSAYWKITDIPYLQEAKRLISGGILNHDVGSGSTMLTINSGTALNVIGANMARWNTRTGLVRSYVLDATNSDWSGGQGNGFEERGYIYDNALAMLAFAKPGNTTTDKIKAGQIGMALARMQDPNGAWPFSQNHMAVTGADKYYRSGAIAWAAYACLKTWDVFSFDTALNTSVDMQAVKQAGKNALDYLTTLVRNDFGTLSGGSGVYVSDVFSESAIIPWHSTEHNVDAWFAFYLGGEVFDEPAYTDTAQSILSGLYQRHWDSVGGKFWQGIGSDGVPDSQGALDVHTWGSILLNAQADDTKIDSIWPSVTSNYAVDFLGVRGYKPYSPNEGYPGAVDALWAEGTFGEIYAKQMHGRVSVSSLGDMVTFQEASGAFAYSINRADLTYEINSYESLASTGWFLLVAEQDQYIWGESPYATLTPKWFRDEIKTKAPIVHRNFMVGTSNYADRVMTWPTIKRSVDKIKPISVSIQLANDDKMLNYFVNSATLLNTTCLLQMGLTNSAGVEENIDLFKGTIEGLSAQGGVLRLNLMDRFKGFGETIIGENIELAIQVDSPTPLTNTYSGGISGKVLQDVVDGSDSNGAFYSVEAYVTSNDVAALQWTAVANADYTFTGTGAAQVGDWSMKCIETATNSPVGNPWTEGAGILKFVDSDHLPGDLLWTLITSYGGLDSTKNVINPDIDYKTYTNWKRIFEGDNIRLNAEFTGQKLIDVMQKFGDLLDSNFMFENNKLRFYRGSIQVSSTFVSLGDESIKSIDVSLDDKKIINKQLVSGGWSVESNYNTINVIDVDSASQVSFGVRESKIGDSNIWFVDSASAKNLAERYIFKQRNPLLNYSIKSSLKPITLLNGDGLHFSDSQLDVTSDTNYYVEGTQVNMDTGEIKTSTRNMPQLDAFILDVDTYSALDQDYNFLL